MYGFRILNKRKRRHRFSHFEDSKHIKGCFILNIQGSKEISYGFLRKKDYVDRNKIFWIYIK